MAYTLTLLGTDTAFTPNPDNGYEKGETLSYVSTLVNRQGAEEQSDDNITKYRNLKIAVVDGPDTMGKEVGDRIARGVASILEAISRGETKISIMAHSRGAVEAILVAHELERIQENFKRDKNSPELTNSVCPLTKKAMQEAHKDIFNSLNLKNIADHIKNVELSIFNIDPVPGGDFLGAPVGWKDDRFFRVPKIVKEYEQCVYENERTRCFKAIVPKCDSSDTKFNLFSLPGHHGTGSGNLKDQQQHPVDMEGKTTEHAQQLMIIKLIDFLTRNEVAIKPGQDRTQEQLDNDPLYKLIQPLIDEEGKSKKEELKAIYLTLYQEIINNKAAYERFNNTSYPVLGQEQSIQRVFGSYRDDRIILHQAYKDAFLSDVLPHLPGGHFVNYDHARLTINQELGLKDGLPLNEVIDKTVDRLGEIMKHSSKLNMLKKGDGEANDLSQSVLDDNCAHAIQSETGFNILVDSLEGVIGEVGNIYCHDKHKSMGEEEREALFHSVKRAIDSFKNDELEDNELAKAVREKINTTVKNILTDKINRLNQDADIISQKLGDNLSEEINSAFKKLLITPTLSNYKNEDKLNEFRDFNNHIISLLKLKPPQIKESKALLEEKLKSLEKADPPDILDKDMTNFFGELLDFIPDYDVNQLMEDATQLYDELESFKESFTHFKELNDSLDYAQWQSDLEGKQRQLIDQTARYIQKNNLNLEKDIDPLFPDNNSPLYEQIKLVASNYGLENPDFVKLKRQNSELSCKIDEQVEKIKEFQQIKERHDADKIKLEELNQELQVLQVSDSAKEREVEEIRHQIVSLKADIQSQTRQKVDLEKQIKNLNSEITWLSTDKRQLIREREFQDKRNDDLNKLLERLSSDEEQECTAAVVTLNKLAKNHLEYLTEINGNTKNDTVKEQIEITKNLQAILNDVKQYPLPSERITAFTKQLREDDKKLGAQHDPDSAWKRFAKSCLITIGVICSGIIPGILALAAYNHFKDKSSPQSFTNKYKNELNKIKQQSDISKHQTEDETQSLTTTGLAR
ncbi:hypothetical protein [Legionella pneumophila]|uniref:hypothetical protein n=2 Tax=Legionella pneumophila TaxID=446 RepID=UPI000875B069|nr:hypothetical protein [Legionella pneumophila]AOW59432.1 hypothetical protein BE843_14735 [Legionella pneumophila subsp. pneumophila]AOW60380.1 hypothetical protein BE844_04040 [Legionella pneumophila subsp. pneumophila]AOW65778.1 hypothetical protein BE846_01805 [Legionella pneumophila subsp. pneumophila]HEE0245774.1 hypothetical protein [Legionella pneumophila]